MRFKSPAQRKAVMAKYNRIFINDKTFKTVKYNDANFNPLSDGLAYYKNGTKWQVYGTKEDLKYMPKKVRLVKLHQ